MSADLGEHVCGFAVELTTSRTTKYRTRGNKELLQIVEGMSAWPTLLRELANRVSEMDRLSRRVKQLEDDLGRYQRHFDHLL